MMIRSAGALALTAMVLASGAATAQPETGGAAKAGIEPSTGVPFQPRNGFFAETHVGVFTAFGGRKVASNAQPYVALSLGMDIGAVPGLTAFFTAAHGYNGASCRDTEVKGGETFCRGFQLKDGSPAGAPDSFSVIPIEVGARYRLKEIMPRFGVYAGAVAGLSLLTPSVFKDAPPFSPHAGVLTGVEYETRLPGLSLGAELAVRAAFSPMIPSFAGYPRIQYVF